MLIPYRVKNPVRRFPIITVTLIAMNIILYAMSAKNAFHIRPDVLAKSAFALGTTPLWRFFLATFLHTDLVHLGANMLFLWVFGPAVEERLGIILFLIVYYVSAMVGALYLGGLDFIYTGSIHPWVGATASVMGIAGAYWYIYAWSQISVFYFLVFWWGDIEVSAFWIVGFYLILDLAQGFFYNAVGIRGGVANIAHVAAGAMAVLLCMLMHVKRDSEAISDAKALVADSLDLSNMPVHALLTMLEDDPSDIVLLRALVAPALRHGQLTVLGDALHKAGPGVIDKDPKLIAQYLIDMHGDITIFKPTHLLRLAGFLERAGETNRALTIYRLIVDRFGTDPDAETALYRMAVCSWNTKKDAEAARTFIEEMQWRFPHGEMIEFARTFLRKLPPRPGE